MKNYHVTAYQCSNTFSKKGEFYRKNVFVTTDKETMNRWGSDSLLNKPIKSVTVSALNAKAAVQIGYEVMKADSIIDFRNRPYEGLTLTQLEEKKESNSRWQDSVNGYCHTDWNGFNAASEETTDLMNEFFVRGMAF